MGNVDFVGFKGLEEVSTLPLTHEKSKRVRVVPVQAVKANRITYLVPHILDLGAG
jgi:hypothetical protein